MKITRKNSARLLVLCAATALMFAAGCREDMQNEPKMIPQRGTTMFADGRSARPQVEHSVARGQLQEDQYFYTGLVNGKEQDAMPFPVTLQVLERGQERFNIYCTPCHSRVGNGDGMIVQRGYKPAGNLHDARRLAQPLSHYFYVMTNGYGAMPNYAAQVAPVDRWAIAAYIRALQLSENATVADVPSGVQVQKLKDIAKQEGLPASYAGPWPIAVNTDVNALPPAGLAAGAPAEGPGVRTLNQPEKNPPISAPGAATKNAPANASGTKAPAGKASH
ncbi:MAG: cytochrome c [Acidobacteriaceae bacterium]